MDMHPYPEFRQGPAIVCEAAAPQQQDRRPGLSSDLLATWAQLRNPSSSEAPRADEVFDHRAAIVIESTGPRSLFVSTTAAI